MTKDKVRSTEEALKMCLEYIETNAQGSKFAILIKEALMSVPDGAQPEPIKIAHKHDWFRTGEMKVGQMRFISCGAWGQEEMPQRKALTSEQRKEIAQRWRDGNGTASEIIDMVEAAHGIKGEA